MQDSMDDKICHLRILLENESANAVVGDNGNIIQRRLKFSTKVTISEEFEYIPGTCDRICSITGTAAEVLKALFIIVNVKKENTPQGSEVEVKFIVTNSIARLIIGEKEENIEKIKKESKVYMRVYKKDYPSLRESCFVVRSYDKNFIKSAFVLILRSIADTEDGTDSKTACTDESGTDSKAVYTDVTLSVFNYIAAPYTKDSKNEIVDSTTPQLMLKSKNDKICHLKLLLKNKVAKTVARANGKDLQKLQKDTKSKITVSSKFEYFPGTSERVCSIAGTADAVLKALIIIIDIIKCKIPSGVAVHVRFVVPDSTARLIAGKNEENMRHIKIKGKAYLSMYKKENYPSPYESCFLVRSYTVKNIETTFSVILEYISNDPENGSCRSISYPRVFPDKSKKNKDSWSSTTREIVDSRRPHLMPEYSTKKDNICYLKILLESEIADAVSVVIQDLQEDINLKIQISKEFEYFPGTSKRVCSITGTTDAVLKVIFSIMDIREVMAVCGSEIVMQFAVPDTTATLIIGADEKNRQQIMKESKTYIRVCDKIINSSSLNETLFVVRSVSDEFIKTAFSLIVQCIALDPVNGTCSDVSCSDGGHKAPENKDRSIANSSNIIAGQEIHSCKNDQLANSSEWQEVRDYEAGSQVVGYPAGGNQKISSRSPSADSGCEYDPLEDSRQRSSRRSRSPLTRSRDQRSQSRQSRSVSPKRRFSTYSPRKRSRSRTKSIEYEPLSPHKKSRKRSRSKNRNYRKRSRSYSRSGYRTKRSRSHSRDRDRSTYSRSPLRIYDKYIHCDSNKIGDKFSLSGTLILLERVCNKCEPLSGMIKAFTTSIKSELESDQSKALRLIEDEDNVKLLRLTANKLKFCITSAPLEEVGLFSKAIEWTTNLLKHVEKVKKREPVEKAAKPEININFKVIAETSLNKTSDFIVELIKIAFSYEGKSNPTEEDINEAFVKVSKLQFEIMMGGK